MRRSYRLTPLRLAKTLLLCNARTVDLYRRQFQSTQRGTIGITLVSTQPYP